MNTSPYLQQEPRSEAQAKADRDEHRYLTRLHLRVEDWRLAAEQLRNSDGTALAEERAGNYTLDAIALEWLLDRYVALKHAKKENG